MKKTALGVVLFLALSSATNAQELTRSGLEDIITVCTEKLIDNLRLQYKQSQYPDIQIEEWEKYRNCPSGMYSNSHVLSIKQDRSDGLGGIFFSATNKKTIFTGISTLHKIELSTTNSSTIVKINEVRLITKPISYINLSYVEIGYNYLGEPKPQSDIITALTILTPDDDASADKAYVLTNMKYEKETAFVLDAAAYNECLKTSLSQTDVKIMETSKL